MIVNKDKMKLPNERDVNSQFKNLANEIFRENKKITEVNKENLSNILDR